MEIIILAILATILLGISGFLFKRRVIINGKEVIIKNNPLGIETILIDGAEKVSKFSFSGGAYNFAIGDSKIDVDYFYRLGGFAIGITVRKDGEIYYSDK